MADNKMPHQIEQREVKVFLTERMALSLSKVCGREKRKREREAERGGFVPEPGKFDANLMRASVMDDIIKQIKQQIKIRK